MSTSSLDGKYVIGDEDSVLTEEDMGEPWRVQVYESPEYAQGEADRLNHRAARFVPDGHDLVADRPYRVYQLKEVGK